MDRLIIPDRPKCILSDLSNEQAKVEYTQYIDILYGYLTTYNEIDSISIGLEGSWGSGKSTILKLLIERIKAETTYKYIEFNPWYITDTANIVSQFFAHIGRTIPNLSDKKNKDIAKCFNMLADATEVIGSIVSFVRPDVGVGLQVGSRFFSFMGRNTKTNTKDIWQIRENLACKMKSLEKPIIVLIDDLDRLHNEEIRNMLTAIRAIGNLPNMIYILAYDRKIVSNALTTEGTNGNTYLEKIIQTKVSVPKINEMDIFNYIMRDLEKYGIVTKDIADNYAIALAFLSECIPTYRTANQLLNRVHYRYQYRMGLLCSWDLFLLSAIEVLAPTIGDIIASCPPVDEVELPTSYRLLDSKQRKQSLAIDVMNFYNISSKVSGNVSKSQTNISKTLNEETVYSMGVEKLREYRAVVYLLTTLFDMNSVSGFGDGILWKPSINENGMKYRIRESQYFPLYFMFANERGCTLDQYNIYFNKLKSGNRAFNKDEESLFKSLFIAKCCYEYDDSNIEVYITLLLQVTSDVLHKGCEKTYDAIKQLIFKCMETESNAIKLYVALINTQIKVGYLVLLHEVAVQDLSPNNRYRMDSIAQVYVPKLIDQIETNIKSQVNELGNSLYPGDLIKFLNTNKNDPQIKAAYDIVKSNDTFYLSFLVRQLRFNHNRIPYISESQNYPFYSSEELQKRLPKIMLTKEFLSLDQDTQVSLSQLLECISNSSLKARNKGQIP